MGRVGDGETTPVRDKEQDNAPLARQHSWQDKEARQYKVKTQNSKLKINDRKP